MSRTIDAGKLQKRYRLWLDWIRLHRSFPSVRQMAKVWKLSSTNTTYRVFTLFEKAGWAEKGDNGWMPTNRRIEVVDEAP